MDNQSQLIDELISCPLHRENFTLLCSTCEDMHCSQCLLEPAYAKHECSELSQNLKDMFKQQMMDAVSQVEKKGNVTYEARSKIPERQDDLENAFKKCNGKIEESFKVIHSVVDQLKAKAIADLERNRAEKSEYYENLYQKIDSQYGKIQDAIQFTNRLIEKGTAVELFASRKKICQQLKILLHGLPEVNTEVELDFDIQSQQELLQKFDAIIGTVKCRISSMNSYADISHLLKSDSNKVPIEGAGMANSIKNQAWRQPDMNIFGRNGLSSENIHSTVPQQANEGPGAIGMERRQNRSSINSNGYASSSFLSGEASGLFSPDQHLSSPIISKGSLSTVTDSMHNMSMNDGFSNAQVNPFSRSNAILNQYEPFNISNATDPYQGRSKAWGSQGYGQNSMSNLPFFNNTDNSMSRGKSSIDPRYLSNTNINDFGLDLSTFPSVLSTTPTPSFDTFGAIQHGGNDRVRTIDMNLNLIFGSTGNDSLNIPQGLALGLDDEVAIADTNNHRCLVYSIRGQQMRQIGSSGTEEGSLYYPKKVVSMIRNRECRFIILDRGANQSFSRLQMFRNDGEYISRLACPYNPEQITVMGINKELEQLIIIDGKSTVIAFEVERNHQLRVVSSFSTCGYVHEASDLAVFQGNYYITDYKTHSVVVFSLDGRYITKFGNSVHTPYPVGIDISKTGDVLVGDSHGNHFHIVVFTINGKLLQDYRCTAHKVSRCTGLKLTTEGLLVTMSRQNSSVYVFNTIYMPSN